MQYDFITHQHASIRHIGLVLAHAITARAIRSANIYNAIAATLAHIDTAALASDRLAAISNYHLVDVATAQLDRHASLFINVHSKIHCEPISVAVKIIDGTNGEGGVTVPVSAAMTLLVPVEKHTNENVSPAANVSTKFHAATSGSAEVRIVTSVEDLGTSEPFLRYQIRTNSAVDPVVSLSCIEN